MHPLVSNIMRATLYPNLKDWDGVTKYPSVRGVTQRVCWLDHPVAEDGQATGQKAEMNDARSKSNKHEAQVVVQLARYLLLQGYVNNDITILTPYLGQMAKIRDELEKYMHVSIDDRDSEELAELEDDRARQEREKEEATKPQFKSEKMSRKVRVATVDNFQGEGKLMERERSRMRKQTLMSNISLQNIRKHHHHHFIGAQQQRRQDGILEE
jgi:hypothetical protein